MPVQWQYPDARRDDTIIDNYHGNLVPDPYRWMEDSDSPETLNFIAQQNSISVPYLENCPFRSVINKRLSELWNYPQYSCPYLEEDGIFTYKNNGSQNQCVLYVQDSWASEARVFLDPNEFPSNANVTITGEAVSEDGKICAYSLSVAGSDWNTIHFKAVHTGYDYPEVLYDIKFSAISWSHDNKGIFYSRYPPVVGTTGGSDTLINQYQKLYYHYVGSHQDEDVLVVEFPKEPLLRIEGKVSDCGRYLLVTTQTGVLENLIYFCDLSSIEGGVFKDKLALTQLVYDLEADYEYITNNGTDCVLRTNKDAPNTRLIIVNLNDPDPNNWTTLVEQHVTDVLDWAVPIDNDKLVVCYLRNVKNVLQIHDVKTGAILNVLPLEVGTVVEFTGKKKHADFFYQFVSFLTPGIIYHGELTGGDLILSVMQNTELHDFDLKRYVTSQVFYESKDGTTIPMFIVHKKGMVQDGTNPCLMYGYGGFSHSIQPHFCLNLLVFIQHLNGVLAVPNIRGGGEFGEAWHNAGRLFKKQTVFDDFQSAAEFLIDNRYTCREKLAIQGGSNGGLLVATCINQRPDLFGAAIAQVGVMDMLRFHKFTIGFAWISDYGSPDDQLHYYNLIKYSPLHNVTIPESGVQYPATLLLTADHDDRVVPLHSLKYIATLQHTLRNYPQQTNPLLLKVDTNSGHGGARTESSDILCFLIQALHLTYER